MLNNKETMYFFRRDGKVKMVQLFTLRQGDKLNFQQNPASKLILLTTVHAQDNSRETETPGK